MLLVGLGFLYCLFRGCGSLVYSGLLGVSVVVSFVRCSWAGAVFWSLLPLLALGVFAYCLRFLSLLVVLLPDLSRSLDVCTSRLYFLIS
jgi:xanthine/uracil/vitamin C permease (AzgA family)